MPSFSIARTITRGPGKSASWMSSKNAGFHTPRLLLPVLSCIRGIAFRPIVSLLFLFFVFSYRSCLYSCISCVTLLMFLGTLSLLYDLLNFLPYMPMFFSLLSSTLAAVGSPSGLCRGLHYACLPTRYFVSLIIWINYATQSSVMKRSMLQQRADGTLHKRAESCKVESPESRTTSHNWSTVPKTHSAPSSVEIHCSIGVCLPSW